jgi:hypothetical protein
MADVSTVLPAKFSRVIGAHLGYGLTPARAQSANIEDPLARVETGHCEDDDTFAIVIHGGIIAVDGDGDGDGKFVMTYNTEGMVRGVTTNAMEPLVKVY